LRRSRIGIRGRQKKINITIVLLFLFILPIMAIIIGSKITEWWVIPTINTDEMLKSPEETIFRENGETEESTQEKQGDVDQGAEGKGLGEEVINLNPMSIYMIQVASISDNKNIGSLVENLNNHNLPHFTYKSNGAYKVYTFASTKRENIENKVDRVREIYKDAYIGQMHIPQKQVHYLNNENKGTKEIIEDMNSLLELLEQYSDSLYSLDNGEAKLDEYREILGRHQKLLSEMLEKVDKTNLPKDFASADDVKKMIEYQERNTAESLKIIEKNQELYKLQSCFSDNLFRTVEVIKK